MYAIAKKIHYVWVGPNELPELTKRCIGSWKKYLPEYDLVCWNEYNSPMNHPYVQTMYAKKQWAFVSDYIRFWALYHHGGIYFDTDMEMLKALDNDILSKRIFFGSTSDGMTGCGIIGSEPQHPFLKDILNWYDGNVHATTQWTSPRVVSSLLSTSSSADMVTVFPYTHFYPCDDGQKQCDPKQVGAYTTHHWAESWVPFANIRKVLRRIGLMPLLKRILKSI